MKIDLEERLSKALQGVNGEEQTVLVMHGNNDGSDAGVGVVGMPHVLGLMFATLLDMGKRGVAKGQNKTLFNAILAALYETYTIEELRDKYYVIDAFKAAVEHLRKPIAKS